MLATLAPPAANAAWRGARSGRKGSRNGAFGRLCRTKAQAGRPWIHAAFARVEHGRPLRQRMLPQRGERNLSPYLPTTSAAPKISRLRRGKAATRSRFSGLSVRPGSLLKPEPRRPEGTPAYSSSMFLTYMPPSSSASSAAFLSWASRCSRAFCRRARCMASR